jgi:predicted CopG family antitoxin
MKRDYTTVSVDRDTMKVLDKLKSRGQNYNGLIQELIEKSENQSFEDLLTEAEKPKVEQ